MCKATTLNRLGQITVFSLMLLLYLAPSSADAAVQYNILDLGYVGGPGNTLAWGQATGINDSGQVIGAVSAGYGFRTAPNSPINPATDNLGTLGGSFSSALGINNSGQVVGAAYLPGNWPYRAYRTAPNQPINPATDDLGTLGGNYSMANGINNSGQVTGWAHLPGGATLHAFRTAPNQPINPATDDLGTLGGSYSGGYGINNFGQVAGQSHLPGDATNHAFRTAPNSPINPATDDLGTLGGSNSSGTAINNLGQVIGYSTLLGQDPSIAHAFLTAPNSPINPATDDLGVLPGWNQSYAQGVNDAGQVVGFVSLAYVGGGRAFLYSGGQIMDLNDWIPPGSGWELIAAYGINNSGQITGWGYLNGQREAFLLTPVPEPATLTLLAAGGIAALLRRKRSR